MVHGAILKIMGNVFISPNLKKTSERIDPNGNVINPKTKQIITPVTEEYVPPATPQPTPDAPQQPTTQPITKDDGLSVLQQIEATKQKLAELEELKKLKIAQKRAELEILES